MAKFRLEQVLASMKGKEEAKAKFEAGISTLGPVMEVVKAASEVCWSILHTRYMCD